MRLFLALGLAVLAGCPAPPPDCRVGADCASGVCLGDGTCAPLDGGNTGGGAGGSGGGGGSGGSGGGGGAGGGTGGSGGSGGGSGGSGGGSDGGVCAPNRDGVVARSELFFLPGVRANQRVARDVTFDTAGTAAADGGRVWALEGALTGDQTVVFEAMPIAGAWFEGSFAGATYAVRLSAGSDLLGVFEATSSELLLRGVVSPTGGTFRTEMTYAPPAVVLRFPIQAGATWSSSSTVSGLNQGFFNTWTEDYSSGVNGAGEVKTPFANFDTLRVHTALTRTVGLVVTVTRTHAFIAECFGPVATLVSQAGESQVNFTDVAEARRLTP